MSERKPIIPHILVSGLAGAALIALWVGNPLESAADTGAEPGEVSAKDELAPKAAPIEAAPKVRLALATTPADTQADMLTVAVALEAPVPEIALVEVPDLKRMSAWEARKQLKKRGLGFTFKNGRRRVHHGDYDFYRVRKQSLAAGDRVAPGTKVTMQVRERQFASGY